MSTAWLCHDAATKWRRCGAWMGGWIGGQGVSAALQHNIQATAFVARRAKCTHATHTHTAISASRSRCSKGRLVALHARRKPPSRRAAGLCWGAWSTEGDAETPRGTGARLQLDETLAIAQAAGRAKPWLRAHVVDLTPQHEVLAPPQPPGEMRGGGNSQAGHLPCVALLQRERLGSSE